MGFFLELVEFLLIFTRHPAYRIDADRLINTIDLVFFFQTIGHYFKLQHTDRTHDQVIAVLRHKYLGRTFFRQLF